MVKFKILEFPTQLFSFLILQFYSLCRGQAWQMFTHKHDDLRWDPTQNITEKSCPTDFGGWTFKGRFKKDMKAVEVSPEKAAEQGICLPKNYWSTTTTSTTPTNSPTHTTSTTTTTISTTAATTVHL